MVRILGVEPRVLMLPEHAAYQQALIPIKWLPRLDLNQDKTASEAVALPVMLRGIL